MQKSNKKLNNLNLTRHAELVSASRSSMITETLNRVQGDVGGQNDNNRHCEERSVTDTSDEAIYITRHAELVSASHDSMVKETLKRVQGDVFGVHGDVFFFYVILNLFQDLVFQIARTKNAVVLAMTHLFRLPRPTSRSRNDMPYRYSEEVKCHGTERPKNLINTERRQTKVMRSFTYVQDDEKCQPDDQNKQKQCTKSYKECVSC